MEVIISRLEASNDAISSIDEAHVRSQAKKIAFQIESLERERASLVSQYKRCQGVLSPLRRFPAELLEEIFSWVVTENSAFEIPMKLSHICKRWREVALNLPDLWTTLVLPLTVNKSFAEQSAAMFQVISTYIHRACNRPMSLSCHLDSVWPDSEWLTVIQQATPSVRWKSINLSSPDSEDLGAFFYQMAENYTSITTLHLRGSTEFDEIIPGGIDILSLVNLRNLSIDISNDSKSFADATEVPWSQLTSLTMTTPLSSLRYLGILRECINVVTCSIQPDDHWLLIGPDGDTVESTEKVHLPRLKRLKLHHSGKDVPLYILIPLVAPLLEEFAFSFQVFPQDLDTVDRGLDFYADFIDRHGRTLQTLSVPGSFVKRNRTRNRFNRLSSLTRLHFTAPYNPNLDGYSEEDIQYYSYNDELELRSLVLDHSKQDLTMPLLESIELGNHPLLSERGQDVLAEIISSRCAGQGNLLGPRSLRRLVVGFWYAPERERCRGISNKLRALQRNGVCVEERELLASFVLSIV